MPRSGLLDFSYYKNNLICLGSWLHQFISAPSLWWQLTWPKRHKTLTFMLNLSFRQSWELNWESYSILSAHSCGGHDFISFEIYNSPGIYVPLLNKLVHVIASQDLLMCHNGYHGYNGYFKCVSTWQLLKGSPKHDAPWVLYNTTNAAQKEGMIGGAAELNY